MVELHSIERPARRGLALVLNGLALATVLGAAWVVSDARSGGESGAEEIPAAVPSDWPITFELPLEYDWSMEVPSPGRRVLVGGDSGAVAFLGRQEQRVVLLVVSYAVLSPGVSPWQVAEALGAGRWVESEPVRLGPLRGRWGETSFAGHQSTLLLAAATPEGLGVVVELQGHGGRWELEETFRGVCRSITFRDWWVAP